MEETKHISIPSSIATLRALVLSTRPKQWTKNVIIYFAFFLTIQDAWDPQDLNDVGFLFGKTTLAFVLFSIITGAVYLFNDIFDAEKDRQHPKKRSRPLASGQLPIPIAAGAASLLVIAGLALSFLLEPYFGVVSLIYLATMVAYTLLLKRLVLLDVMAISAGFVLRAAAGAVVIDVPISPWLYICTALGALLIALGKRRNELELAGDDAGSQRDALEDYSPRLLDQLIAIVAPSTLVAYILYTFTADNLPTNNAMMLTIPFVVYGLFRYLYLVHRKSLGENPEDILITDLPLILDILLWLATAAAVLLIFRG